MKPWIALLLAAILVTSAFVAVAGDLEGFDEDVVEQREVREDAAADATHEYQYQQIPPEDAAPAAHAASGAQAESDAHSSSAEMHKRSQAPMPPVFNMADFKIENFYMEAAVCVVILIYIVIIVVGMRANRMIGHAWAAAFAFPGGMLDRNFSYRGPKASGALLMRESAHVFKFYASGRRYCQGLLGELQLLARQDLLSMVWQLVSPAEDLIKMEAFMHDTTMPPIVLAVATAKAGRALQRDALDIQRFTKRIGVGKDMPTWPSDKLWVLAEHGSVFQDLFSDPRLQQLFAFSGGPNSACMKYFRSMHLTSEVSAEGGQKNVLRFVFKLPPKGQMAVLAPLMELVPTFIDVVGTYKLPADLKKRAMDARTKQAEEDEEARRKRQDALMQKKQDKALEERARVARMNPEARQKYEEKMQRQQTKKAMKTRMVRM